MRLESTGPVLNIQSHIFNGDTDAELRLTAKQYTSYAGTEDGLTLVFAHCLGAHKEQWEPTIEGIFQIQRHKKRHERIREAWAFDWQSHGDGAVVNERLLESRTSAVSALEWARAVERFIRTDLRGHRIVLLGHSAGAGVMLTVMKGFPVMNSPFVAVFLVEPMVICQELFDVHAKEREDSARRFMELTLERRDIWPDRNAALEYLRKRAPWRFWDSRVLERYLSHGLRTMDTIDGQTVGIKTKKRQEGLSYIEFEPYIDATMCYRERCAVTPFHLIFGTKLDFVPLYMQDALCDASTGYRPASVVRVPNAGHLIVQEQPDALARAICDQLKIQENRVSSRL